jgi:leishmanolysin/Big-like domain-containing protein
MSRDNTGLLLAACLLAACSTPDAPSAWPAALVAGSVKSQPGLIGYDVNAPPSVRLLDAEGKPVAGAKVTFARTAGGGALTNAVVTTGADGIATVGGWSITTGANQVTASIPAPFRVPPVTFTATGVASSFNITLSFVTPASPAQIAVFDNAAANWQRLIYGDIPDIPVNIAAGGCFGNEPAVNQVIDDVIIFVTLDSIDGPLGILGAATPCYIRTQGRLPLYGVMVFDTADLHLLDSLNLFQPVITHEMGHVLGFGTLWDPADLGLLAGPAAQGGTDPYFTGGRAVAAFDRVGGTSYTGGHKVPVEALGGPGTADSHWRESVFGNELMTGFVNPGGANPLSLVTVASMGDEGYLVNYAGADPYVHPFTAPPREGAAPAGTLMMGNDILRLPIYLVDPHGTVTGQLRR